MGVKQCTPGGHCERHASGLGGCVAGYCNPPAPAPVDWSAVNPEAVDWSRITHDQWPSKCPKCGAGLSNTSYEPYCAYTDCRWNNAEGGS